MSDKTDWEGTKSGPQGADIKINYHKPFSENGPQEKAAREQVARSVSYEDLRTRYDKILQAQTKSRQVHLVYEGGEVRIDGLESLPLDKQDLARRVADEYLDKQLDLEAAKEEFGVK